MIEPEPEPQTGDLTYQFWRLSDNWGMQLKNLMLFYAPKAPMSL